MRLRLMGLAFTAMLALGGTTLFAQAEALSYLRAMEIHRGYFLLGKDVTMIFEGATTDAFETTLTVTDPTADNTITMPDGTGSVVISSGVTQARIVGGTVVLDGSNPTSVTTGLAAIIACTVQDLRSAAPGIDPAVFTVLTTASAGRLDVYAWKHTSSSDPTLEASTDADDLINYLCIGSN